MDLSSSLCDSLPEGTRAYWATGPCLPWRVLEGMDCAGGGVDFRRRLRWLFSGEKGDHLLVYKYNINGYIWYIYIYMDIYNWVVFPIYINIIGI